MAKRFTDTDKWKDKWFRRLPAEFKLAYLYLLDQCDQAGVVELDADLADFQIGLSVDWPGFEAALGDRIARIDADHLLLVKFIDFQYGELSEECRAHNPVFASIKKHDLDRVFKGYSKGIQRVHNKDKDKDKDFLNKKKDEWVIPEHLDTPEIRRLLDEFAAMRQSIKKPIKSQKNTSRGLKNFDDPEHLKYAIEFCIANEYQGLKPEYRPEKANQGTQPKRKSIRLCQ
jgi:hypothetical protein